MSVLGVIIPAALSTLGGAGRAKPARKIGSIVANVTIDERHEDRLVITQHPVEQGAQISDHAYKMPASVVLRVAWSNSVPPPPAGGGGLLSGVAGVLTSFVQGAVGNAVSRVTDRLIAGSGLPSPVASVVGQLGKAAIGGLVGGLNSGTGKGTSTVQDVYQSLLKLQASAVPLDIYTGKRVYKSMLIDSITTETDVKTENSLVAIVACTQVIIVQTQLVSVASAKTDQKAPAKTASLLDAGIKQLVPVALGAAKSLANEVAQSFPIH